MGNLKDAATGGDTARIRALVEQLQTQVAQVNQADMSGPATVNPDEADVIEGEFEAA
jgi:hypothetical protein